MLRHYKLLPAIILILLLGTPLKVNSFSGKGLTKQGLLAQEIPREIKDLGIVEHLNETIDLTNQFVDESGKKVPIGKYFSGTKPVVLSLVYYSCPNLCNLYLNGVTTTLKKLKLSIGADFTHVVVSIDPNESPPLANDKKANYVKDYGRGSAGWHFLTGQEKNIKALASQVGFHYRWDDMTKQWVHAAAAIILTPKGVISRYHSGVMFNESNFRLSLVEASNNKIGTLTDRIILFCLQYNPDKKTYAFYAFNAVRIVAGIMALCLGGYLFSYWYRQSKRTKGT